MGSTLRKPGHSIEVHSLDLRMAKASIAVHSEEKSQESTHEIDVVSIAIEALAAIGMSDKEACFYMAFDASQFSRVKRGEARLPIDALWRLPAKFWVEFRRRIDAAKGLTTETDEHVFAEQVGQLVTALLKFRGATQRRTA